MFNKATCILVEQEDIRRAHQLGLQTLDMRAHTRDDGHPRRGAPGAMRVPGATTAVMPQGAIPAVITPTKRYGLPRVHALANFTDVFRRGRLGDVRHRRVRLLRAQGLSWIQELRAQARIGNYFD